MESAKLLSLKYQIKAILLRLWIWSFLIKTNNIFANNKQRSFINLRIQE